MNYSLILDTETTSLDKPFCYDISWIIMDNDTGTIVDMKANVVEQVWHNLPLFESAYYKDKRQKYILMMRKHDAIMNKWGYIMKTLKQDIKRYFISEIYAYNSDFRIHWIISRFMIFGDMPVSLLPIILIINCSVNSINGLLIQEIIKAVLK